MEKRKKRIVLVALTGLLSSSILVGCNKNHEENSNKIAEIEHNESDFLEVKEENALVQEDQKDSYFTPNLVIVEYKENGERHANVVNVQSTHEDVLLWDFVTDSNRFYKDGKIINVTHEDGIMVYKDLEFTDIKLNFEVYSYIQQYCKFGEGLYVSYDVIKKVEECYGKSRTINSLLAQDANGEWKEYPKLEKIAYTFNGKTTICLMGLESESNENGVCRKVYRSLTMPEITLIETYDEERGLANSSIVTGSMLPEQNEELKKFAKIKNLGSIMTTRQLYWKEVLEIEENLILSSRKEITDDLLKVREELNVSIEEDTKYAKVISIGDYVNLMSENTRIYKDRPSLKKQENSMSSYYGTSLARCISSIDMTNGYEEITVYNMEDYELYQENGYSVIGYGLVNQYSLNEDGTLNVELRCDEDDVYCYGRF